MANRSAIRVLVVEDDPAVRRMVCAVLGSGGYSCAEAADAAIARQCLATDPLPDIVLLDWMLGSGASGIRLLQLLRSQLRWAELPVILLTARSEENDRVRALDSGADDYLVKPFRPRELRARIRAVLRRSSSSSVPVAQSNSTLLLNGCELHMVSSDNTLRSADRSELLRPVEFRLLYLLATVPGRVFSRAELGAQLGLRCVEGGDRAVDVHISRLRRALSRLEIPASAIVTLRGRGYRLVLDSDAGELSAAQ